MEKYQCPYCGFENKEQICSYCGSDFSTTTQEEKTKLLLKRTLDLAVIAKNSEAIKQASLAILESDASINVGKYFLAYAEKLQGNSETYDRFISHFDGIDAKDIIYHMIKMDLNIDYLTLIIEKCDLTVSEKEAVLGQLKKKPDTKACADILFPLVTIRPWEKKDMRKVYATVLTITGAVLLIVMHLLLYRLPDAYVYFAYVLGFLVPNIFIAMGIRRYAFVEKKDWFVFVVTFGLMIITIYLALITRESNIIAYLHQLIRSPIDFFKAIYQRMMV